MEIKLLSEESNDQNDRNCEKESNQVFILPQQHNENSMDRLNKEILCHSVAENHTMHVPEQIDQERTKRQKIPKITRIINKLLKLVSLSFLFMKMNTFHTLLLLSL